MAHLEIQCETNVSLQAAPVRTKRLWGPEHGLRVRGDKG